MARKRKAARKSTGARKATKKKGSVKATARRAVDRREFKKDRQGAGRRRG